MRKAGIILEEFILYEYYLSKVDEAKQIVKMFQANEIKKQHKATKEQKIILN